MSIQILNNGASLKIIRDGVSRLVIKTQIKEVSVSGTKLKIEICGCGSSCLFFPFAEISSPVVADVTALRDAVNVMLNNTIEGGSLTIEGFSTEAKQDDGISELQQIKTGMSSINSNLLDGTDAITTELGLQLSGKSTAAKQDEQTGVLGVINAALNTINASVLAMQVDLVSGLTGKSTEVKQNDTIAKLIEIKTSLTDLNASLLTSIVTNLDGKSTEAKQIDTLTKLQEIKTAVENVAISINGELDSVMAGTATADKQDVQTTELENIKTAINSLRGDVQNSYSYDYRYAEALRMDTVGGVIYKGFATAGAAEANPVWAIQRISSVGDGNQTIEWASGNRNFINIWTDRATLIYS